MHSDLTRWHRGYQCDCQLWHMYSCVQGASTIRVPVARYHSSHTRLGPRNQGVPMPPSPQTVQADDMPDAQRGQLTNDSTTEHAALPAGPQTPAILLAATPSVQQQSAENRPTAVASAMPQTSVLMQQTATPKLLTTGAAPPGLQCNPSTALPMPPVISAVRHHLPPSPPRAILRNAGTTANMPKQKVSAHVSAHDSTSNTVRQEEDQNFLACKLDKLFHPKLLVKMDKSSLMRLCARCVLWFYDGVYIDTSLLACLKTVSKRQGCEDGRNENADLHEANYKPVGLGNSSQSKSQGMEWLQSHCPDVHELVQKSPIMTAATPNLKTSEGADARFLKLDATQSSLKNKKGYKGFFKVLKAVFVDIVTLHVLREHKMPPPSGFGMRMHKTGKPESDVPWNWSVLIQSSDPQCHPLTLQATAALYACITSGLNQNQAPTNWFIFMRDQTQDDGSNPVKITTDLPSMGLSVLATSTRRHAAEKASPAAALQPATGMCPPRRKRVANALPGETPALKRTRSDAPATVLEQYEKLVSLPTNKPLTEFKNSLPVTLYNVDFRRCAPGGWINDNIINAMAIVLQRQNFASVQEDPSTPVRWLVSSQFLEALLWQRGRFDYDSVQTHRRQRGRQTEGKTYLDIYYNRLENINQMIAPINFQQAHWGTAVVDFNWATQKPKVTIMDSLGSMRSKSKADPCLNTLIYRKSSGTLM
eukprot:jgi/Ulvmu1/7219/UM035_0005.1